MDNLGSDSRAVGAPDPAMFLGGQGEQPYLQVDFLWSIPTRAGSEKSAAPARTMLR